MKQFFVKVLVILGYIIGIFLIIRAGVEPFTIDYGNPKSYANSWGGPSLVGVLAVHMLPGIISFVLIFLHQKKRVRSRRHR